MNLVKKIKLYLSYRDIISKNRIALEGDYNLRIDRVNRLYTVINIPPDLYGEPYNLRKGDIDTISESYIKEYIGRLSHFLNTIGLSEIYGFYEPIKKVDKYSYLIILGFKPFNSLEFNRIIWKVMVPILGISILIWGLIHFLF